MRDVVGAHGIAVCFGLACQPIPADTTTCARFVDDGDGHAQSIVVPCGHSHDPGLEVRSTACTIAYHQHDGAVGVICVAVSLGNARQGRQCNGCTCE